MIQQQGFLIVDLNQKIHQVEAKDATVQKSNKISDGDLISFGEVGSGGKAFNTVNNNNTKKYSELYQKAAMEVSKKGLDEEYEDVEDDDDNDSFITIDSDADSEATLEEGGAGRESESSDSGYTDYADLSYGVNPLFSSSLGAQDTASQRCQDFVFFKQSQDSGMQTLMYLHYLYDTLSPFIPWSALKDHILINCVHAMGRRVISPSQFI